MKTVPRFLHGPFRNVMKVVLEEVMASEDPTRKERGWKAFLMLPRMLLHRPSGRWSYFSQQVVFALRSIQQRGVDPISRMGSGRRLGVEPTIMVRCLERCQTRHSSARRVRARWQTWLATRGGITRGPTIPRRGLVCQDVEFWSSACPVSGRGLELVSPWPPVQLVASPGSNRSSFALSFFAASISLFPCLPVWPSTRSSWAPPCSLCKGWDLGKEGVRVGDCDRSDLSGGRRQSHDERHGP